MKEKIRETLCDFGATSPTRDWTPIKGKELKNKQKEVKEHINLATKQILQAFEDILDRELERLPTDREIENAPHLDFSKPYYQGKFDVLMNLKRELKENLWEKLNLELGIFRIKNG